MKKLLLAILFVSLPALTYSQNSQVQYGLDVLNMVRYNYDVSELKFSPSLSEYALKKATQFVNGDEDEVIISKEEVGLNYIISTEEVAKKESEMNNRFALAVLSLIDIDCDKENKYDLFNQVVDPDSKEIGIAEYYDNNKGKMAIVFVYDHYVYNQETDSEEQ